MAAGLAAFDDSVGDRTRLYFGSAGRDDERVGDDRAAVQRKDDDVFRFLIEGGVLDEID